MEDTLDLLLSRMPQLCFFVRLCREMGTNMGYAEDSYEGTVAAAKDILRLMLTVDGTKLTQSPSQNLVSEETKKVQASIDELQARIKELKEVLDTYRNLLKEVDQAKTEVVYRYEKTLLDFGEIVQALEKGEKPLKEEEYESLKRYHERKAEERMEGIKLRRYEFFATKDELAIVEDPITDVARHPFLHHEEEALQSFFASSNRQIIPAEVDVETAEPLVSFALPNVNQDRSLVEDLEVDDDEICALIDDQDDSDYLPSSEEEESRGLLTPPPSRRLRALSPPPLLVRPRPLRRNREYIESP